MSNPVDEESTKNSLETALRLIDPILQFLTKATGETSVPISTLQKALPQHVPIDITRIRLLVEYKVLHICTDDDDEEGVQRIGFPPDDDGSGLHGSTKRAAQRRLTALRKVLQPTRKAKAQSERPLPDAAAFDNSSTVENTNGCAHTITAEKTSDDRKRSADESGCTIDHGADASQDDIEALEALESLLGFETAESAESTNDKLPSAILPRQVSFAGSNPSQEAIFKTLAKEVRDLIPDDLWSGLCGTRKLYSHQATMIEAAMKREHCSICTGTGSGKSMCFLLPVLTAAYRGEGTSLLLFPTKALAQDQLSKLHAMLKDNPSLSQGIQPATLDGDTPQALRRSIAENSNVILTNPDTLHAAILPAWKSTYRPLLSRLQYIVIDEAHTYDGIFGAHVAMILRRLARVCENRLTFISASATLPWPQEHFRLLCPVLESENVAIVSSKQDGSPRAAKHFFVWNPPVLKPDRTSTGQVTFPRAAFAASSKKNGGKSSKFRPYHQKKTNESEDRLVLPNGVVFEYRRRHAADETALLLAKAVVAGVRCIAFCKTRGLVEWVYSKTVEVLKGDPKTENLVSKVESYRGGYSMKERRKIEQRLFQNDLRGVVGTSALELGVDLGGVDLTLHCGYPTSYASLLQQAGRAGRGAQRLGTQSIAIVICFNSPSEQHMWKRPKTLLARAFSSAHSIPMRRDLVQGHLLCASEESPLTHDIPSLLIHGDIDGGDKSHLRGDRQLFGCKVYDDSFESMRSGHSFVEETISNPTNHNGTISVFKARPSFRKSWSRVSIRSIEPINYSIVDLAHPSQAGMTDTVHSEDAVLDVIPYRYKIVSMSRPPPFVSENFAYRKGVTLAAFAKPTNAQYTTRPLSKMFITVVKQMESVSIDTQSGEINIIGCGEVNVKRQVHGYKKLSLLTRQEIGRFELSLPSLEYDTFGIYICADPSFFIPKLGDLFGHGVHALSHALLAVAPVFAPGIQRNDLECDHSYFEPTQVVLFDERAGGSGCVERLWGSFFQEQSIIQAAVDLLKECAQCSADRNYDYGCPACIQAQKCLNFNMHLSKKAAIMIGEHMLLRLRETYLYKANLLLQAEEGDSKKELDTTPRRKHRMKKMKQAKELQEAKARSFVIGRTCWPLDGSAGHGRHETL